MPWLIPTVVVGSVAVAAIVIGTSVGVTQTNKKKKAAKEKALAESRAKEAKLKRINDRKRVPDLDSSVKPLDDAKDDDFNRYMTMCTIAQNAYADWVHAKGEYQNLLAAQRDLEARYWKAYTEWSSLAETDFDGAKRAKVERLSVELNEISAKVKDAFTLMNRLENEYYAAAEKRDALYAVYEESLKKFEGVI